MSVMPASYDKRWAGMPGYTWLYVNPELRGGTVTVQMKKAGASTWSAFTSVAVPTTACSGSMCDQYGLRQLTPRSGANGLVPFVTYPAAGTYDFRHSYSPGKTGNGSSTPWTASAIDGYAQQLITVKVPLSKVTTSSISSARRGKVFTLGVNGVTQDPARFMTAGAPYNLQTISVRGVRASVTWVPSSGAARSLGTFTVGKYADRTHTFVGRLRPKAPSKPGRGKLRITFLGGTPTTNMTVTTAFRIS